MRPSEIVGFGQSLFKVVWPDPKIEPPLTMPGKGRTGSLASSESGACYLHRTYHNDLHRTSRRDAHQTTLNDRKN